MSNQSPRDLMLLKSKAQICHDTENNENSGNAPATKEPGRCWGDDPHTTLAAQTEKMTNDATEGVWWIKFAAYRDANHHTMRADFLSGGHRWLLFLIILTGAAGFLELVHDFLSPRSTGAIAATIAALHLVFDLQGRAASHEDFKKRYYDLAGQIEAVDTPTPAHISKWKSELIELTSKEGATFRALNAKAHNNIVDAHGANEDERLHIPWEAAFFSNLLKFDGRRFKTSKELVKASKS